MITLQAQHLKKSFKQRCVVNDVNITLQQGACIGLLGPNGAGKTTCFYMIVGLQSVDSGHIVLNGEDITHCPIHARARKGIGYLPQEASVFRKMTVEDNLLAILELRQDLSPTQRETKAHMLLDEFRIAHLKKHIGLSLSGGERRRLEIARALASNPSFILLDEPFAGIDPISMMDIKRMIQQLCAKKIGILLTDHQVREALDICEYAYIMNEGKILCEGTPQHILSNEQVKMVYLGETFEL